jgi:hypothetical protein
MRAVIPVSVTWLTASVLVLAACSDQSDPAGPGAPVDGAAFSVPISVEQLSQEAASGPTRLEVKLISPTTPLVAREVEVEEPEEVFDEEKIESRVTGVSGNVITLELGSLTVEVGPGTSFRDERSGTEMSQSTFLAFLEDALAGGRRPAVEAKRTPPSEPQDPDDPSFFATKLRLNDESEEPEIEMNVDADNVEILGPGQARLRMLGLDIAVDASGGRTEVEQDVDDDGSEIDFEGLVNTVDLGAGTVTLQTGVVIRIVAATTIEQDSGGDDDHLRSMDAVAAAVDAGRFVEAEGEGMRDPDGSIVAIEVEFEIEDDADDMPGALEFEGTVSAVDLGAGTVTLGSGSVILITTETRFDNDGDLFDLASTKSAVDAGLPVRAEGDAAPAPDGSGLVAVEIEVEVDD